MAEDLVVKRETIAIAGARNLYSYAFEEATAASRLIAMIETGETGVIGPFLELHPELELSEALKIARRLGNEEAIRELTNRMSPEPNR